MTNVIIRAHVNTTSYREEVDKLTAQYYQQIKKVFLWLHFQQNCTCAWYTNIIRLDEKLIFYTLGGPGLC